MTGRGERDLYGAIESTQRQAEVAGEQVARSERDDAEWELAPRQCRADRADGAIAACGDHEGAVFSDGAIDKRVRWPRVLGRYPQRRLQVVIALVPRDQFAQPTQFGGGRVIDHDGSHAANS